MGGRRTLPETLPYLRAALASLSYRHEVRHDATSVAASLDQYAEFFQPGCYVQLRIARRAAEEGAWQHQLNFRAEVFDGSAERPEDASPPVRALRSALKTLTEADNARSAELSYLADVLESHPTCAAGADFDPAAGLVKLWHFGRHTAEELCALPSAPEALRGLRSFFHKHSFSRVFCTGVDLARSSLNIYFRLHEGFTRRVEDVLAILEDLGLEAPDDQGTLAYIAGPGTLALTLRWDTPGCERACFYMVPPTGAPGCAAGAALPQMPSHLRAFAEECKLPHCEAHTPNSCFVSCSFGRASGSMYIKQESDWYGSYHDFIQRVAEFATGHECAPKTGRRGGALVGPAKTVKDVAAGYLEEVRGMVAMVLRGGEHLADDSPLFENGLDSSTAAFLRGQLSSLAGGPLPGAATFERPSIAGLAEVVRQTAMATSTVLESSDLDLRVRAARHDDWPSLECLWRSNHHLREAVAETTHVFVLGPPAWVVVAAVAVLACRASPTAAGLRTRSPCLLWTLGYALVVLLQHVLHWLCATAVLLSDLRWGDLTAGAWLGERGKAVLVAESSAGGVVGVVCVRLQAERRSQSICCNCGRRQGTGGRRKGGSVATVRARQANAAVGPTATLWHAAVAPQFRSQGAASALIRAAEVWARDAGAARVEMVCLGSAAKAACWNARYTLWNARSGRLPLVPASFSKSVAAPERPSTSALL